MTENCKDCQYGKLAEKLETKYQALEGRVSKVESRQDVSDEKFKQVFEKLDEIIGILKQNQSRVPNMIWGVSGSVAGGVMIWLIMNFIQR